MPSRTTGGLKLEVVEMTPSVRKRLDNVMMVQISNDSFSRGMRAIIKKELVSRGFFQQKAMALEEKIRTDLLNV